MLRRRADGTCRLRRRSLPAVAIGGLAQATLIATYDYWGYYNITFLGSEVRQPEQTIPRAILLSVLFVAAFYVVHEFGGAAVDARCRRARQGERDSCACNLWPTSRSQRLARGPDTLMAALVMWTAFASVFSLLLGYSRVPLCGGADGNYFSVSAAVHPKHGIPHRSLVALGLVASVFCFFTLQQVITMLVVTRILLQFFLQHVGVMLLRGPEAGAGAAVSDSVLSAAAAGGDGGICFILANRSHALVGCAVAAAIAVSGTAIYGVRARRLRQWPFGGE